GRNTVCFPEMRRGGVGICVATQIARFVKSTNKLPGWHSPEQACAKTQGQLGWYRAMEESGELLQITTASGLEEHVRLWHTRLDVVGPQKATVQIEDGTPGQRPIPIGYILSLEGADSLLTTRHLER